MQNGKIAQSGFLKVETRDGVATVTIDRPDRKNAMNQAMWREMAQVFTGFNTKADIRAVILTGAGDDFCAGADISEFDTLRGSASSARGYEMENSAAFAAIRTCFVPTIAAIRGVCFGGGFGLAAACDLRIASGHALFCVPAARLGLAYPVDAMEDIVNAVGPQMAKYLTFTAARLDSRTVMDTGFLLEIVEPAGLGLRALELATTIAANAPLSVRASKASIRAAQTMQPADIAAADALGDATFESADYAEGRAAFLGKRTARFEGR
jgi:enoyl-CoA hydratase/carnithine racemase